MRYSISLATVFLFAGFSDAAYISGYRGRVEHKKAGSAGWTALESDARITLLDGDEVRTARASTAEIYMDDGSKVKLAPLSAFKMSSETKESVSIGLYFGRIRSWVRKFSKKFEVRTPSAVCAVRGTDFMISADEEGNTRVEVYDGSVMTGDASGRSALVRQGEFAEIQKGGNVGQPEKNPAPPSNMDSSVGDARTLARKEIYTEISKEDVIAGAQLELQSAEFQTRKVAIDAFGNRVRMEEYTIRPADNQFKYVVLNTRDNRFDFGKILFTFNAALPADLSLATAGMISSPGSSAPQWQLTAMNSVMSNTQDKVTEDASGGSMVSNGSLSDPRYNLVFGNYSFYAAGPAEANDNGGLGKLLWARTNYNVPLNTQDSIAYLGGSAPTTDSSSPSGSDVFHSYSKNTYIDGTWIAAEDFVLFDDGKILSSGDFSSSLGGGDSVDSVTDRLNFERVYTSSLFSGRTIDLEYSAKLLKDIGMLRF